MRVTGVDACRGGWVAVTLETVSLETVSLEIVSLETVSLETLSPGDAPAVTVRTAASLAALLGDLGSRGDLGGGTIVGIDMPLGLLETGWREADRAARGLLGPRRSSVFAIPPRLVWAEPTYAAANQRCRELAGQGFSVQAWGLRTKLLEANLYRETCGHPLYEVHPELAFGAMAGAPLAVSKHTRPGRDLRRGLLARAGIELPAGIQAGIRATVAGDVLDAAAVAWSACRIATGRAVTLPAAPQHDGQGREITIRY